MHTTGRKKADVKYKTGDGYLLFALTSPGTNQRLQALRLLPMLSPISDTQTQLVSIVLKVQSW